MHSGSSMQTIVLKRIHKKSLLCSDVNVLNQFMAAMKLFKCTKRSRQTKQNSKERVKPTNQPLKNLKKYKPLMMSSIHACSKWSKTTSSSLCLNLSARSYQSYASLKKRKTTNSPAYSSTWRSCFNNSLWMSSYGKCIVPMLTTSAKTWQRKCAYWDAHWRIATLT